MALFNMASAGGLGAQQAAQSAGGLGGFLGNALGGISRFNQSRPEFLLALGQMVKGDDIWPAIQYGANVRRERKAEDERRTNAGKTRVFLRRKGYTDEEIDAYEAAGQMGALFSRAAGLETGDPTDDMREYDAAVKQGFDGTFMDYMVKMKEAGRNQVNINTGEKLPANFRWIDPNNQELGVEPIPGGPGEQMPAELAARIGMADSFLGQLPDIRKSVQRSDVTGWIDQPAASRGIGKGANTYRQIQSGVDALMRLLTGAGMNETEAEAYAARYLPTIKDDEKSMAAKLDQLERELKAAKEMATRGRGGQGGRVEDPLGIR